MTYQERIAQIETMLADLKQEIAASEIPELPQEPRPLREGDLVVMVEGKEKSDGANLEGKVGVVRKIPQSLHENYIGVEWAGFTGGHHLDLGVCASKITSGWRVPPERLVHAADAADRIASWLLAAPPEEPPAFKVGDLVQMSPMGLSNLRGLIGIVRGLNASWVSVEWAGLTTGGDLGGLSRDPHAGYLIPLDGLIHA
jgi:hypothetical protein